MAQAASTALPPFWNIMAPAVAASGLPVIATQCRPCSTGLAVAARAGAAPRTATPIASAATAPPTKAALVLMTMSSLPRALIVHRATCGMQGDMRRRLR